MNKILIVYYSRTGTTKKIAEFIRERLDCDIEEIISVKSRSGVMGYILSGKEATLKIQAKIKEISKDPANYDLVIVGTPVWAWNISSPIRTYLENNKEKIKNIAVFCTMGGDGDRQSLAEIEKISGKKIIAQLAFKTKEVQFGDISEKLEKFIEKIKR